MCLPPSLLLTIGCLCLYLVGAGGFDFLTDDEIRYAEAGRMMLQTGDWIMPEFNGYYRYQKPISFYWLQALAQILFGSTAWACRLPAALAGTGVVLLTYHLGKTLWGSRAGIWSAIVLATSVEFVLLSRMVMTDVVLLFFVHAALTCFILGFIRRAGGVSPLLMQEMTQGTPARLEQQGANAPRSPRWFDLMAVCLGLGALTKGPVALILPIAVLVPVIALRGETTRCLREMRPLRFLLIFAVVALPWYIWADWHTDGRFTQHFFFEENISRFTSVVNTHHQPVLFYLLLLIPMTFPWTGLIPAAVHSVLKSPLRRGSFSAAVPWLFHWQIIGVLALFSCSSTRVWTYTLPLFPPLALLIGRWIAEQESEELGSPRWLRPVLWAFSGISFGGALLPWLIPLELLPHEVRSTELQTGFGITFGLLSALSLFLLYVERRSSLGAVLRTLAIGVTGWFVFISLTLVPAFDRIWKDPMREVARQVNRYPHAHVITYRIHELGLNFHTGVFRVHHWRDEDCLPSMEDHLNMVEPVFVIVDPTYLYQLKEFRFWVWGSTSKFVYGANFPRLGERSAAPRGETGESAPRNHFSPHLVQRTVQ